jgi:hypothetical protein
MCLADRSSWFSNTCAGGVLPEDGSQWSGHDCLTAVKDAAIGRADAVAEITVPLSLQKQIHGGVSHGEHSSKGTVPRPPCEWWGKTKRPSFVYPSFPILPTQGGESRLAPLVSPPDANRQRCDPIRKDAGSLCRSRRALRPQADRRPSCMARVHQRKTVAATNGQRGDRTVPSDCLAAFAHLTLTLYMHLHVKNRARVPGWKAEKLFAQGVRSVADSSSLAGEGFGTPSALLVRPSLCVIKTRVRAAADYGAPFPCLPFCLCNFLNRRRLL